jgi:ATP-binding cassette subfamily B protein
LKNFREILHFLKPHWKLALVAPLLVLIEVGAELAQPKLMAEIVNNGVLGGEEGIILPVGLKMLFIILCGMVGGVLSIYAAGKVSYAFGADIREALFRKIEYFSFENIDKLQAGSLITRMTSDITRVQHVVQASMRLLFRAPFLFIGSIFMFFSISGNLTFILFVLLPILLFSVIYILRKAFPLFLVVQRKMDRLNTVIQETMAGIRVVKAYVREEGEKERFGKANDDLIDTTLKVSKTVVFLSPIMSLILNIGIVAVIWFGAKGVVSGDMNIGDIMACTNYMAQVLMSLMMASRVIMSITQAQASMERIQEVLHTENKIKVSTDKLPVVKEGGNIVFDHVWFRYGEQSQVEENEDHESSDGYVLRDISFSVKSGETLAIVGGTGSGKTTLVHLLSRFYDVTEGRILIDGEDIRNYTPEELRKKIGIVMQKTVLFSGTIEENLRWGKKDATDEELRRATSQAQIDGFIQGLKDGYDYYIEQGAVNLSGGQKQRLSIARTLLARPEIIILDDSLSAVDYRTESNIRKVLSHIPATKVIIAQRIGSIMDADKILLLEDGNRIGYGTHEELLESNQIYNEIYRSQTG